MNSEYQTPPPHPDPHKYQHISSRTSCPNVHIAHRSFQSNPKHRRLFLRALRKQWVTYNISNIRHWPKIPHLNGDALHFYTTLTNFSTKYFVMCKVYTDVGGIKLLYHVCPPVRKIIHSLKLVDYLHVQADNPWYNYYISNPAKTDLKKSLMW